MPKVHEECGKLAVNTLSDSRAFLSHARPTREETQTGPQLSDDGEADPLAGALSDWPGQGERCALGVYETLPSCRFKGQLGELSSRRGGYKTRQGSSSPQSTEASGGGEERADS